MNEATVLKAPLIYSPLGLFDCCPTTDGAAAVVVCRADLAKSFAGSAGVADGHRPRGGLRPAVLQAELRLRRLPGHGARVASRRTAQAGIGRRTSTSPRCTTASRSPRSSNYEDLGFCRRGEGGRFVEEGRVARRREAGQRLGRRSSPTATRRRDRRAHDLRARHAAAWIRPASARCKDAAHRPGAQPRRSCAAVSRRVSSILTNQGWAHPPGSRPSSCRVCRATRA